MPKVRAGDIDMYYEVHGEGEPLVMIQGLGTDISGWALQVAPLSERYRVVLFDNRGVGRSDTPEPPYSVAKMTDDTVALIDALGIDRAHVLGLSLGGMVAQELAVRMPQRLKSLVLVSTASRFPPLTRHTLQVWLRMAEEGACLETRLREMFSWWFTDRFFEKEKWVAAVLNVFLGNPHPQPVQCYRGQIAACLEYDSSDCPGQIAVPALVVAGRKDILVPCGLSQQLADGIPGSELAFLEGAGHAMHAEIPDEFNRVVLDFLGRVTGRG